MKKVLGLFFGVLMATNVAFAENVNIKYLGNIETKPTISVFDLEKTTWGSEFYKNINEFLKNINPEVMKIILSNDNIDTTGIDLSDAISGFGFYQINGVNKLGNNSIYLLTMEISTDFTRALNDERLYFVPEMFEDNLSAEVLAKINALPQTKEALQKFLLKENQRKIDKLETISDEDYKKEQLAMQEKITKVMFEAMPEVEDKFVYEEMQKNIITELETEDFKKKKELELLMAKHLNFNVFDYKPLEKVNTKYGPAWKSDMRASVILNGVEIPLGISSYMYYKNNKFQQIIFIFNDVSYGFFQDEVVPLLHNN